MSEETNTVIKFTCHLISVTLLGASFALAVAGQTEQQPTSEPGSSPSTVAQAQALLNGGKLDAAIEMLRSLPASSSTDTTVNHLLGLAYYQKSDYARAIEHLTIAVKQGVEGGPQHRQGMQMLGLSQYLLGHLKEAIPYLEQVGKWSPNNVEIAYVLGLSYIQTQNPDKAREAFARMFNIQPNSAPAYLINGQMMIRQRLEEVAEKELQKAIELDPKLPQVNFLLGELAIFHANIERGIELLQKEIAINPAFGMAYYRLGEAYTRQLKWDEAIAPLQKSIWLNPYFSGPYLVLGKVHLKKGDLSNAESILRRALNMDPNNFSGHHLLAQVLQQANRLEEAKKEFETADQLRTSADKKQ
ncbi:MAG: tetratricopeptide repeat protein [Pyrinomonadaceae bacterium]|nr:tetratricopeptide repeat protein [Pyrinomonadaceae bacterium]